MKEIKVQLTFTEDVLGTSPSDKEIHETYIVDKGLDEAKKQLEKHKGLTEEEKQSLEKIINKLENKSDEIKQEEVDAVANDEARQGRTVFPRDEEGNPFIWDYQMRGFFKSAAQAGSYIGGDSKLTAYKKKIDLLVFIDERKIPLNLPDGKDVGSCQRPLRGQTAQGERVALANSDSVPAGTTCEFTVRVLDDGLLKYVRKWLDYGRYNGFGQWRNSGKGRFKWREIAE